MFNQRSITQLIAADREKMLQEINPTTSGAREKNQSTETITEVWLSLHTPKEREAATAGGDIAGFLYLDENTTYAAASCITPLPTIRKAMVSYGCQWGNDISQVETGYINKEKIYGSVLVPMLETSAQALKLTFCPHDIDEPYMERRNGHHNFNWPDQKTIKDFFPNLDIDQKVVLASLPNVIPYGFGAAPAEGPVEDLEEAFAHMDNGPEMGVDLRPIHHAIKLLIANGGRSFHMTLDAERTGGVGIAQIDNRFKQSFGGEAALRSHFESSIERLDRRSRDGMRVREEVTKFQNLFAEKWILENDGEAQAYLRNVVGTPIPPRTTRPTHHREEDVEDIDSDDEKKPKRRKKLTTPRAFGLMGLRLLLCTSDNTQTQLCDDTLFVPGEVNEILKNGFHSKDEISTMMYDSHRDTMAKTLSEFDTSAYRRLTLPPMTKVMLNAMLEGKWSTTDPTEDKKGCISLATYYPMEAKERQSIEDNIETAQADIDVGQASHNRSKILTSLPKSWAFKTLWTFLSALRGLNAELLIASKQLEFNQNHEINNIDKPTLCLYNESLIVVLESSKCATWYSEFKQEYPHIAVSLAHKVGSCISKICKGAFDYTTNIAAQGGTMPDASSVFTQGLEDYAIFISKFTDMVNGGDIGQFGFATSLYKKAFPPPPRADVAGGRGSGRGGRGDQLGGGRGRGGRGAGGPGRGHGGSPTPPPPLERNNPASSSPKLFVNASPGTSLNFREIRLPQVRAGDLTNYLCGAAHVQGMSCTRPACRFLHLPPSGLAALDDVGRERLNLCVRQSNAINWANDWLPTPAGGTPARGTTTPTGATPRGTAGNRCDAGTNSGTSPGT